MTDVVESFHIQKLQTHLGNLLSFCSIAKQQKWMDSRMQDLCFGKN